eukprot:CAMPEP_0201565726 /NCGR_PEP_ID=MMETSP0190_2-20130828/5083_1 /ASSEMBLY_ACC=CAM_ASM_000263 /TAXON_ID=37353 /ORGANISM="Rosalina sp." /LENGTH=208 /DNA_ID=CAMNT_0047983581 /DNA_START=353 /DNA_END=979 /DNA_ORIENTATION=+
MNNNNNNTNDDDEFDKYDIKFEDDNQVDSDEDTGENKELRHRLLEEQMRHEQLKHQHRQSISKLEQYEIDYALGNADSPSPSNDNNNDNNNNNNTNIREVNDKLREEVESLRRELENEKKKRENLDKERRNSLAALSQNMFKKLLDSEHQHYDDKSDLEKQCNQLKLIVKHLEKSKQKLLSETSKTIDDLRDHIKLLSQRLQKYENWD